MMENSEFQKKENEMSSDKYFDTWKHITTLTSALIVVVVGVASKVSTPDEPTYVFGLFVFGLLVVAALTCSVFAMYKLADSQDGHITMGLTGLISFSVALIFAFVVALFAIVKNIEIFEPRIPVSGLSERLRELEQSQIEREQWFALPYCGSITGAMTKIQKYEQQLKQTRRTLREYEDLMRAKEIEIGCTSKQRKRLEPIDPDNTFIGGDVEIRQE
jgi:hypothetical protein